MDAKEGGWRILGLHVSISISLNAPVSIVLECSMIFSPHIINLSFDPPITSVCYEWCKINSQRVVPVNLPDMFVCCTYARCGFQCICKTFIVLTKYSLFPFFSNTPYSFLYINTKSKNKNWQIVKCNLWKWHFFIYFYIKVSLNLFIKWCDLCFLCTE